MIIFCFVFFIQISYLKTDCTNFLILLSVKNPKQYSMKIFGTIPPKNWWKLRIRLDILLESSSVAWKTGSVLVSECWTDTALKLFWGIISQSYFYGYTDRPKLSKKFLLILICFLKHYFGSFHVLQLLVL